MKITPLVLLSLLIFVTVFSTITDAKSNVLTVEVQRIKNNEGKLHYQLFSCPLNDAVMWDELTPLITEQVTIEAESDNQVLAFSLVESGRYIIRLFQDLNQNKLLDFSDSGIPTEPTGFSDNPSLFLGYPLPIDTCFVYDLNKKDSHAITIKLNYKNNKRKKRK